MLSHYVQAEASKGNTCVLIYFLSLSLFLVPYELCKQTQDTIIRVMSHVCSKVYENVKGIYKQTTAFRKYEVKTLLYKCRQVCGMWTGCRVQDYCSEAFPSSATQREKYDPDSVTWQPLINNVMWCARINGHMTFSSFISLMIITLT